MSEEFGLFSRNSAGYGDIPKIIASPGEREHVRTRILAAVFTIQGPDLAIRQNRDTDSAAGRARSNSREPRPQSFRASVCSAHFGHAHLEAQICPPFPVNDS